MKLALRLFVKIITAPVVLSAYALILLIGYGYVVYDWLYDSDNLDKEITAETLSDLHSAIKRWFTRL
jgi:hypothetical protein